jgi:TonB family protein
MKKHLLTVLLCFACLYAKAQRIDSVFIEEPIKSKVRNEYSSNYKFPGGLPEFYKYIDKNLRYPQSAEKDKLQGTVYATFMIDTIGKVSEVDILRGLSPDINAEVIRVIKASPKWIPVKEDDVLLPCKYTLPLGIKVR